MSDFENDSACIAWALEGWANHIETSDMGLSRDDIIRIAQSIKSSDKDYEARQKALAIDKLIVLTEDQKAFVARLRTLAKKTCQKVNDHGGVL